MSDEVDDLKAQVRFWADEAAWWQNAAVADRDRFDPSWRERNRYRAGTPTAPDPG